MRRIRRLVVCFAVLLLCVLGVFLVYSYRNAPRAVLWAGSDLQGEGRDGVVLAQLLSVVKQSGYRSFDEALFLGDYSSAYDAEYSAEGIGIVCDRFSRALGMDADDILFLQGNHDPADTVGLDAGGPYERDDYIVYLIHEGDFPAYADESSAWIASETAARLDSYLAGLSAAGDERPVFVMTHVPLHMSWREDNRYARWLVDVLNAAGARGTDLFVLFGHNHSDDYDSYLGGSCIYLAAGDDMLVPDPTAEYGEMRYDTVNLQFTYLNAGYVGFTATGEDGEERTCTVISIYDDRVEIRRFDTRGVHALKNQGSAGILDGGWAPDLTVTEGVVIAARK